MLTHWSYVFLALTHRNHPAFDYSLKKHLPSLAGIGLTGSINIKSMSDVITDQHRIPMWPGIAVWGFPRSQNHIISSVPIMRKITILNSNLREFCKYPPPPPPPPPPPLPPPPIWDILISSDLYRTCPPLTVGTNWKQGQCQNPTPVYISITAGNHHLIKYKFPIQSEWQF